MSFKKEDVPVMLVYNDKKGKRKFMKELKKEISESISNNNDNLHIEILGNDKKSGDGSVTIEITNKHI